MKVFQGNNQVVLEWPEGETLKVTREISFDHFRMGIRTGTDWFEVDGSLAVDDDLALDMSKFLDRAADGPALIVAPTSVCHNWKV